MDRPIYLQAGALASRELTGIGRYTARVALALAKRADLRLFEAGQVIVPPAGLSTDEDQDLATWGARVWQGSRKPLVAEKDSVGLYTCLRPEERAFPIEGAVLHDLTPLLLPHLHIPQTIVDYQKYFATNLLTSDFAISVSHSTRADCAWLSEFPESAVHVGHSGPSLCVGRHLHAGEPERKPNVGLVVATLEPRKNAEFLIDWFLDTDALPADRELWWVGATGWHTSKSGLAEKAAKKGRKVKFLGFVDDQTLCRLYKTAGWMAYPSLYEGFGFPVLDALRHGLPVLTAGNSSLREFAGPGVSLFDPCDPATLDRAFVDLKAGKVEPPQSLGVLDGRFSWNRMIDVFFNAINSVAKKTSARLGPDSRAA